MNNPTIPLLFLALQAVSCLVVSISSAHAAPSICSTHYHNGLAPDIIDSERYPGAIYEHCTPDAGLMYSVELEKVLWVAEHLIPTIPSAMRLPNTPKAIKARTDKLLELGFDHDQAGSWIAVENAINNLSENLNRDFYVISGSVYNAPSEYTEGKIDLPTHLYKIVLDPIDMAATAYVIDRATNSTPTGMSAKDLTAISSIRFFLNQEKMPMLLLR